MVIPLSRKRYIMKTLFYYIQTMLECCINSNIEREKNNYFARAKGAVDLYNLLNPDQKQEVAQEWAEYREKFIANIYD